MKAAGLAAVLALLLGSAPLANELSFEQRVRAQEAIERVYYSHQIGTTIPFERAVPRELLERKVRTYLRQSVALERFWQTPVTAEALQRELERIAGNTRLPDRLHQIYAALGEDPILIQECFARPFLVDRLTRSFFATDGTIHEPTRKQATSLREELVRGDIDALGECPGRSVVRLVLAPEGEESRGRLQRRDVISSAEEEPYRIEVDTSEFDRWRSRIPSRADEIGPVVEEKDSFVVRVLLDQRAGELTAATYAVPKTRWEEWWDLVEGDLHEQEASVVALDLEGLPVPVAGEAGALPGAMTEPGSESALSSCEEDMWDNAGLDDIPDGRVHHTTVWTGSLMVVWGGESVEDSPALNTGGRYDPLTDTWAQTTTRGASRRKHHTAVWTGSEMVVWGGSPLTSTGGRYDPVADTWTPTSTVNAPSARLDHTAVWTGSRMIVWGGVTDLSSGSVSDTGGRYDPVTDTWTPTSTINAPIARYLHSSVWTGAVMVVWGGYDFSPTMYNSGGRYDPVTDTWLPTSTIGAPVERSDHTAVWTGSRMMVWGGDHNPSGLYDHQNTGGLYDPLTDTWNPTSTANAPSGRSNHTSVWTGSEMLVWGGRDANDEGLSTGGRYDPNTDAWTPTSTANAPSARRYHEAVWTGSRMITWGGSPLSRNTGGRYDPVTDSWTPTATGSAPTARVRHTAIWTGTSMVVWGGFHAEPHDSGGRYDPLSDTWVTTTTTGAPSVRFDHTAVWTGSRMVVWGGSPPTNTGGRYDPLTDNWIPTSTTGAPSARWSHTSIWTGSRMIVWGGNGSGQTYFDDGGSYDPTTDTWIGMSVTDAPSARDEHVAVWTGSEMLVWGGHDTFGGSAMSTGGRYDPQVDAWSPMSTTDAPPGAFRTAAVWTGSRMIVWGGFGGDERDTGGRYDPITDTWVATSLTSAPSPRWNHTAVWTGNRMIVWGEFNTGGLYDPVADLWTPTTTIDAPGPRSNHSAVWTGTHMIVWGGSSNGSSGGRYLPPDADQDGTTRCDGDCDDTAAAVYSGAPEICDGVNNDCMHPSWPGLSGTIEADDDGDTVAECQGDCDDMDSGTWGVPGPVGGLTFTDDVTLIWSAPAQPGGTSLLYDTLRSIDPIGFASSMSCVESGDSGTSAIDAAAPPLGSIAYYLARAQNECGLGSAGAASDGNPRGASDCP